jgi:hypothetical protein
MSDSVLPRRNSMTNMVLLGSLYVGELCALLVVLALYRLANMGTLSSFLSSRPGLLCLTSGLGLVLSGIMVIIEFRRSRSSELTPFALTVAMNLLVVVLSVGSGELAIRLLSTNTEYGVQLGSMLLYQREWKDLVARHSAVLHHAATWQTVLVFDELLGWTVGSNRTSGNGLYFSSREGLRSPKPGIAFADRSTSCRIALVGDSYTFGQDVRFEDSWGHHLELALGEQCQVLNFAVSGYGVDQAYLRYMRDVRPWHPDIVIFAFINHNVVRTMSVYGFLLWPEGYMPWAKPRFVLAGKQLSILNAPLPKPEEIFSRRSIRELPHINYHRAYRETEWDRHYWRYLPPSYLFRFLLFWYPHSESPNEQTSDRTMKSFNATIFRSFFQAATSEGSIPIVVYLPEIDGFHAANSYTPVGITMVRDAGLEPVDLTTCLSQISFTERFVTAYGHYSSRANAQVASCLLEVVTTHLSKKNGERQRKGDSLPAPQSSR